MSDMTIQVESVTGTAEQRAALPPGRVLADIALVAAAQPAAHPAQRTG